METWTREQIKKDPVLLKLMQYILKIHNVPDHTVKNLLNLQHIENICEETTLYLVMTDTKPGKDIYLSYTTATWIKKDPKAYGGFHFPTRVNSITMYDDFVEYETTRIKSISAADPDGRDASSLNLN